MDAFETFVMTMFHLAIRSFGTCLLVLSVCPWVHSENVKSITISEQPFTVFHHPKPRILDGFGMAITQHRGQVLVGAPNAGNRGKETGQAFLFNEHGQGVHAFEISTVVTGSLFGQAVALSDQSAIIGAPHGQDKLKTRHGAVYVFDRITKKARFTLSNPQPLTGIFGHALAVGEKHILVGDPQASTSTSFHSGAAFLFDKTSGALLRTFRPDSAAAKRPTQFGHEVAMVSQRVFVGAPFGGPADSTAGIVYLFDGQTGNLLQTYEPPNPTPSLLFGWSFAANERVIVIGAFGFHGTYREEGIVYLFDVESGELLNTLKNPTPTERARFGKSVALLPGFLVVGAPGDRILETGKIEGGVVHLFDQSTGAIVTTLQEPLPMTGASDIFGDALFSDEKTLLISAPFGGTEKELDAGVVYQYDFRAHGFSPSVPHPTQPSP